MLFCLFSVFFCVARGATLLWRVERCARHFVCSPVLPHVFVHLQSQFYIRFLKRKQIVPSIFKYSFGELFLTILQVVFLHATNFHCLSLPLQTAAYVHCEWRKRLLNDVTSNHVHSSALLASFGQQTFHLIRPCWMLWCNMYVHDTCKQCSALGFHFRSWAHSLELIFCSLFSNNRRRFVATDVKSCQHDLPFLNTLIAKWHERKFWHLTV